MNKPPAVGDYYRLDGYYKPSPKGGYYGESVQSGIYIVTGVDINTVELRLISKEAFHGSGRRWLKKSKLTDSVTHAEFKQHYKDDAIAVLTAEFQAVKNGYETVLGQL